MKMNFCLRPILLDTSQRLVDAGRNDDAIRRLKALIEGEYVDYELVHNHAECMRETLHVDGHDE
jgi:hypothetical protein